jgi:hypothetical protein
MAIAPLPRRVRYKERDGKTKTEGWVIREASLDEEYPFGDFHKLIQLIDFKGKEAVRLGYYVKDHGAPSSEYKWGSQTTFILHKRDFKELMKRAKTLSIL